MASFGSAHKSSRKQELHFQKELEDMRKKAFLQHLMERQGGSPTPPSQEPFTEEEVIPRPPSKPKPADLQTRKKVAFTSPQKSTTAKKQETEPQSKRLTINPTKDVKFAIASALQTSSPVTYAKREPAKPVKQVSEQEAKKLPKIITNDKDVVHGAAMEPVKVTHPTSGVSGSYYLSCGVSNKAKQSSSSFTTTTLGSDAITSSQQLDSNSGEMGASLPQDTVSDGSSVKLQQLALQDQGSGLSLLEKQSSIQTPMSSLMDRDGLIGSETNIKTDYTESSVMSDMAGHVELEESTQKPCTLKLEIDLRFKQEDDEQSSRASNLSFVRSSTVQSSDYHRSASNLSASDRKSSRSEISHYSDAASAEGMQEDEVQKSNLEPTFKSSDADLEQRSLQASSRSLSGLSDHTLKEAESKDEPYETLEVPGTYKEVPPMVNRESQENIHSGSQSLLDSEPSKAASSKASSFYMQSTVKGDMSTTLTGYHPFSGSMSSLGLTFSIPSQSQFSNGTSGLHESSEPRPPVETQGDLLSTRLNVDRMFASSEHHLMTSSWLEGVNVARSSVSGSLKSDAQEGVSVSVDYSTGGKVELDEGGGGGRGSAESADHGLGGYLPGSSREISDESCGDDDVFLDGSFDGGDDDAGGSGRRGGGGAAGGRGGGGDDSGDEGDESSVGSDTSADNRDILKVKVDTPITAEVERGVADAQVEIQVQVPSPVGGERVETQKEEWLETDQDGNPLTLAEFLAYSKGPVTLADIMKVKGQKLELSPHKQPAKREPDPNRIATLLLSKWEPVIGVGGKVYRPSIHHYCAQPEHPQLPTPMIILSRKTHTHPSTVSSKTRQSNTGTSFSTMPSTKLNVTPSTSKELDSQHGVPKSVSFVPSLPSKHSRSSLSSRNLASKSTSSGFEDDIVDTARARLKREMKEHDRSESRTRGSPPEAKKADRSESRAKGSPPEAKKPTLEGGVRASLKPKGSLRSTMRESQQSKGDRRSAFLGWETKGERSPSAFGGEGIEEGMVLTGTKMEVSRNPGSLLWSPAAPKLSLYPATIQSYLFPKYETPRVTEFEKQEVKEEDEESELTGQLKLGGRDSFFASVPAFSTVRPQLTQDHGSSPRTVSPRVSLAVTPPPEDMVDGERRVDIIIPGEDRSDTLSPPILGEEGVTRRYGARHLSLVPTRYPLLRRDGAGEGGTGRASWSEVEPSRSMPHLPMGEGREELKGHMNLNFKDTMKEVKQQRDSLISYHSEKTKMEQEKKRSEEDDTGTSTSFTQMDLSSSMLGLSGAFSTRKLQRQAMRAGKKGGLGHTSSRAARTIRRTKSAQMRIQKTLELVSQPPHQLSRTISHPSLLCDFAAAMPKKPSTDYRRSRRLSEPAFSSHHFPALMWSHGVDPTTTEPYKWAFDMWWDTWFPQVLRECREEVARYSLSRSLRHTIQPKSVVSKPPTPSSPMHAKVPPKGEVQVVQKVDSSTEAREVAAKVHEVQEHKVMELADIEPLDPMLIEKLHSEVASLSRILSQGGKEGGIKAVQHCRRGALLRKLGHLKESREDLDRAIFYQPTLSDAHWHRHLLFLLQGDEQSALEDLTTLLKLNKRHVSAYHSKAVILTRMGKYASAIYNLSQAIGISPEESDLFLLRAELYEKRGEMEYALSDYSRVTELDLTSTEPLKRQAMHKYNKNMWAASTQYFSALLLRDPNDTTARLHRAKAQYNLGRYVESLQDLSASIHLEPTNHSAFYFRACLLRTTHPGQALKDFSMSLLLDHSVKNVAAFVHRGVLYTEMKCYDEALADFESAIKLKYSLPSPHVLAGLIHMDKAGGMSKAIRCFSAAISVDPTCVRAYLCRAEGYKRDGQYRLAALDYTRLIHFEPNNQTYYLYRGEVYLILKEYKLAAMQVKIAAKLTTGFNLSKTQRALVEAFLGNHQQAITLLRGLTKTADVFSLLGKIQLKAKMYPGAADSFRQSIQLMPKDVNSRAMSEAHFMCGQSLRESGAMKESIEEYNKVLNARPNHVKVYKNC